MVSILHHRPQTPIITHNGKDYAIDPDTGGVLIPLGGKKFPGLYAIVDREDVPHVAMRRWCASDTSGGRTDRQVMYVSGYVDDRRKVYLHRYVLGLTDPAVKVDHINHNTLDNRRCNLRVGSHQQNLFNRRPNRYGTSPYKGVSWKRDIGRWVALIKVDGKVRHLGRFDDEVAAARAYDQQAAAQFGDRAWLNFPDEHGREAS